MKYYFKSSYQPGLVYSPGWYGTLDYAPTATILLYDDNNGFCIGYVEDELPEGLILITESDAQIELTNALDINGVYFGYKLMHRWDVTEDG